MSYILEALRKVEQQREHLPAHGLSSRRRYYSAIDTRFWSRPWVLASAAITGASLAGAVVAYLTVDDAAQQTSVQQQEPALIAPYSTVAAPGVTAAADDSRQSGLPAVTLPADGATPPRPPVRPAALRMPGPRYQPAGTSATQPQVKATVQPPDTANVQPQVKATIQPPGTANVQSQIKAPVQTPGTSAVTKNEQAEESEAVDKPVSTPAPATPPETRQPTSPEDEPVTEVASVHPSPNGMKSLPLPAAAQESVLNALPGSADSLDAIPPPRAVEVQPFRPNDVIRPPAARRTPPGGNPATGETPLLSTLPSQFQSMVPKLAINAQVYSAVPAQRFVVINMKRYNEGQSTSEGVNVVAIRQQDIVFSFQGQRFRLGR